MLSTVISPLPAFLTTICLAEILNIAGQTFGASSPRNKVRKRLLAPRLGASKRILAPSL